MSLSRWLGLPWPPQFFVPGCFCCASSSTCAGVGTVGSEGGSECTSCSTLVISDDFSGTLDNWVDVHSWPEGTNEDLCLGEIGEIATQWQIGNGRLRGPIAGGAGGIVRSFPRPALAGLCIEVRAKVYYSETGSETGVAGITLGYGRLFFGRPGFNNYGRQSCVRLSGCVDPIVGSNFQVFGPSPSDGDELSLIFREEGAGDGVCTVCYKVNGSTVRIEEGVITTFPTTCYAGVYSTLNNSRPEWENFEVLTS